MEIKKVWAVYWSPVNNTRTVVRSAAETAASKLGIPMEEYDWTVPADRKPEVVFNAAELVFFGVPTYAGKVPNKILPLIGQMFKGGDALAVPVVTFGNRSYDNSLAELCAQMEQHGFHTICAGAFSCRHVFSDTLGVGRPDEKDKEKIVELGTRAAQIAADISAIPAPVKVAGDADAPYYVPKGVDGKPVKILQVKPKLDPERCVRCGLCAKRCPMAAINPEDVSQVPGVCVKCHACVRHCPRGARYFDDPAFLSHKAMLEQNFQRRAEAELFF